MIRCSNSLLAITLLLLSGHASCQERGFSLDIGGLMFGDLYWVPSHHDAANEKASGAVLRRGYLTLDAKFGDGWSGRLRFELNQSGAFETYTFDSQVKDLSFGRELGSHKLAMGLTPTITYDLIESVWGKRYLARTPMDLQGVPSRDVGVSLKGPLNSGGTLNYRLMAGLGAEFGADSNDHEKWMAALTWKPANRWTVDFYADFEQVAGPRDRTTGQVFVAYQGDHYRWGVQYSDQDREEDPPLELASGFFVADVRENISLIGRIDRLLEPSPKGEGISYLPMDSRSRATQLFAGVEFRLNSHLALTPNVVNTHYDRNDEGFRPEDDLHVRLTLFLDFE